MNAFLGTHNVKIHSDKDKSLSEEKGFGLDPVRYS